MYHCTSWELVSSHLIWETIAQSYSGPAKNYATIESSNTVTSGSAISLGGAAGSWTASGSQTHTSGLTKTFTESLSDRNFQMQVKYGKWHTLCPGNYHRYAFTPTSGTGGDRTLAATQYPAMNYCTTISAGLWSRSSSSGNSYSNSVGVDSSITIDIDLSISHNYGTSSNRKFTLHYRPTRTVEHLRRHWTIRASLENPASHRSDQVEASPRGRARGGRGRPGPPHAVREPSWTNPPRRRGGTPIHCRRAMVHGARSGP